ncbi:MAG: iron ABC transporter permease [SAR202 cluster bacterium]|nr:iron ABC transporter permease [SAR202 cluster bacterium]
MNTNYHRELVTGVAPHTLRHLWPGSRIGKPPLVIWIPALLIGIALTLPLVYLVIRGSSASEEAWSLLFRSRTVLILGRSVILVATVSTLSALIAVPIAWLTIRSDIPLRGFWTVTTALPLVIPTYVGGFIVVSALGPKGLLQSVLAKPFGIEHLPDIHGLVGATITLSLLSYPYVLLTVRAALQNIDPSHEETARSLGNGSIVSFFKIVIPQLQPAISSGSLLVALYTLSDFGAVSLLRYESFTWAIYQQYQTTLDRSIVALLSLVLVTVATIALLIETYSNSRIRHHNVSGDTQRPPVLVRMGHWRWPAFAFCTAIVTFALVLPLGVLSYWLIRGVSVGEPLLILWTASRNSIFVSILAAMTTVTCSMPVAALLVRYPGFISRTVKTLGFAVYALPGIVVALSLVYFGAAIAHPIYQTVWILLIAYIVLFFPIALGSIASSLLQIDPKLEDASRGLGRSALETMRSVTLPLMRPGILSAGALVFLVAMKELPATLILGPLEFNTLATSVWSASSEAFFARAAAPALMLVLLSSVPMAFLISRRSGNPL